jgi:hypothetical protein
MRPNLSYLVLAALVVSLVACSSSAPASAQKGTPEFYWGAARDTMAAKDFNKSLDHLGQLLKADNPYSAKATPMYLALASGMAAGYAELADNWEAGARMNKANSMPFRKQVSDYRNAANRLQLDYAEKFEKFEAGRKDEPVALAFVAPPGSSAFVAGLSKIGNGILPSSTEAEDVQNKVLERNVLLAVAKATGSAGDVSKAREMLKDGNATVGKDVFMSAMANTLYDASQLYGDMKLNQPDKMKFFCTHALAALKSAPDSKDKKELETKIQTAVKKIRT